MTSTETTAARFGLTFTRALAAPQAAARRSVTLSVSRLDKPGRNQSHKRSPTGVGRVHTNSGSNPSWVITRDCTKHFRTRCREDTHQARRLTNRRDGPTTAIAVMVVASTTGAAHVGQVSGSW